MMKDINADINLITYLKLSTFNIVNTRDSRASLLVLSRWQETREGVHKHYTPMAREIRTSPNFAAHYKHVLKPLKLA